MCFTYALMRCESDLYALRLLLPVLFVTYSTNFVYATLILGIFATASYVRLHLEKYETKIQKKTKLRHINVYRCFICRIKRDSIYNIDIVLAA